MAACRNEPGHSVVQNSSEEKQQEEGAQSKHLRKSWSSKAWSVCPILHRARPCALLAGDSLGASASRWHSWVCSLHEDAVDCCARGTHESQPSRLSLNESPSQSLGNTEPQGRVRSIHPGVGLYGSTLHGCPLLWSLILGMRSILNYLSDLVSRRSF